MFQQFCFVFGEKQAGLELAGEILDGSVEVVRIGEQRHRVKCDLLQVLDWSRPGLGWPTVGSRAKFRFEVFVKRIMRRLDEGVGPARGRHV